MTKKTAATKITITISMDGENVTGITSINMATITSETAWEMLRSYVEDSRILKLRRDGVQIMEDKRKQYMMDLEGLEKDFAAYSKGKRPKPMYLDDLPF